MNIPDGTRDVLPAEWAWRERLRGQLQAELSRWGYQGVEVPALEFQDAQHPLDHRAFKLVDRGGEVLALRSEFTTAIGRLVRSRFAGLPYPIRLQYAGKLWLRRFSGGDAEPGRLREYSQVGVELVGVSDARSDAELVTVARSALERVGLRAHLEVGHPGFVDAVLEDAGVHGEAREDLHLAIDRKAPADLRERLNALGAAPEVAHTLEALIELYGGPEVLPEAERLPLGPGARAELARLAAVVERLSDPSLGVDLGMSRRYTYYSGFTFRAYAPGLNLPILGGGRYDAGLPGAGFALGLERLTLALGGVPPQPGETVLAADEPSARWAQAQGLTAELAWTDDPAALARYARTRGITRLARGERLETLEVEA